MDSGGTGNDSRGDVDAQEEKEERRNRSVPRHSLVTGINNSSLEALPRRSGVVPDTLQ